MKKRMLALCLTIAMLVMFIPSVAIVGNAATTQSEGTVRRLTAVKVYDETNTLTGDYEFHYEGYFLTGVTSRTYGEYAYESSVVLSYDAAGRLISRISGDPDTPGMNSGSKYTYNNAGQLISSSHWEGGIVKETYEYDDAGNRIRAIENYDGGKTITEYSYNEEGLLSSAIETSTEDSSGDTRSARIVYSYDSQRRVSEVSSTGGYTESLTTYNYQYQPFVLYEYIGSHGYTNTELLLQDNNGYTLHSFYLSDPELYADDRGYLAKVVDTSYSGEAKTLVFYYDEIVPNTIELKAYTAFPDYTIGTEQEVKILFSLYVNGEETPIEECSLGISHPSVIESTGTTDSDGSRIITFKGLQTGTSDLTFTENSTGTSITITVTVEDKCNYFRCSAFPVPYSSIGSIYIADYSCTVNEYGNHYIMFNAYNTSYTYGAVEVYDESGSLIKLVPLDPRSDGSGMEKVVNGFKWAWEDIKDLINGDTPFYTKDSNAKCTPVKLDNIPENAEIVISSDGNVSSFATIYTGVDVFVRTVSNASSIDLKTDGQVKTVKELMNSMADSLIKSISSEESEETIKEGLIKEAAESISTSIAFASSTDSISDVYETVYNLFQSLDIDAESIMLNVLKGMGYSVADTAFTTFVPLYKIVNVVDLILETTWPLMDYEFNLDRGKMEIHVSKHGLQNFVANSSVTISQQSNFSDNTVLDAYEVMEIDELSGLSDSIPEEMANYAVYNITLREDGTEVQPNGEIEVHLPVPYGADGEKCVVYRIEKNGKRTLLQSCYNDGYITFITTHLSYYVIGESVDSPVSPVEDLPDQNYSVVIILAILGVGCIFLGFVQNKRRGT